MSFESEIEFDTIFGGMNTFVRYESELQASLSELLNDVDIPQETDGGYFEDISDTYFDSNGYFEDVSDEDISDVDDDIEVEDKAKDKSETVDEDVNGGGYFTDIPASIDVLKNMDTVKPLNKLINKDNAMKQKIESKYKNIPQITVKNYNDILTYIGV